MELAPGRVWLTTLRSHDQFGTVFDLDDRSRSIFGHRPVVMVSIEDIEALGFEAGDEVRIVIHFRGRDRSVEGLVVVPHDIPRGNVAC